MKLNEALEKQRAIVSEFGSIERLDYLHSNGATTAAEHEARRQWYLLDVIREIREAQENENGMYPPKKLGSSNE